MATVSEKRQKLIDEAADLLGEAAAKLEELFVDLDEKRSNLKAKFSGTKRYARLESACSLVQEVMDEVQSALEHADVELPL